MWESINYSVLLPGKAILMKEYFVASYGRTMLDCTFPFSLVKNISKCSHSTPHSEEIQESISPHFHSVNFRHLFGGKIQTYLIIKGSSMFNVAKKSHSNDGVNESDQSQQGSNVEQGRK